MAKHPLLTDKILEEMAQLLEEARPAIEANGPPTHPGDDRAGFKTGTPQEIIYGSTAALHRLKGKLEKYAEALIEVAIKARQLQSKYQRDLGPEMDPQAHISLDEAIERG